MAHGPVVESQHVAGVGGAPSGQRHAPAYAAVQPGLAVPVAVGSHDQCAAQRVDEGVGGLELYAAGHLAVQVNGVVEALEGIAVVHEVYAVAHHHQVGEIAAARGLAYDQPLPRGRGLEGVGTVHAQVAVALQLRVCHVAHDDLHLELLSAQLVADELPDGALGIVQRHHVHANDAVAHVVPAVVAQQVGAYAVAVPRLAVVGRV